MRAPAAIVFCLPLLAMGQMAPPSAAGNPPNPAAEEAITLSPFAVNADRDVGYVAASSLAGSRLNTDLKDTAASISVLTSEFLSDIGATDLGEALAWSANSQPNVNDAVTLSSDSDNVNADFFGFGSFRVRGLTSTITRNYFSWQLPTDVYNIERVEEARGPNSILFGIGSAGGILNLSTKKAMLGRDVRSATLGLASEGGYRGTIDFNQRFGKRFALRLNAVADHTESFRRDVAGDKRFAHLAAVFRVTSSTVLRGEYETGRMRKVIAANQHATDRYSNWQRGGGQVITAPIPASQNSAFGVSRLAAAAWVAYIGNSGTLMNLANQYRSFGTDNPLPPDFVAYEVNAGGPGAMQRPHFDTVTISLEQRIGQKTFVELSYNHQQSSTHNHQATTESSRLMIDPNARLATGQPNPNVGRYMLEGESWVWDYGRSSDNTRLSVAHELNLGRWGNYRFAGLAEHEWRRSFQALLFEVWEGAPFHAIPENQANVVRRLNYVDLGDWGSFHRTMPLQTGLVRNLTEPVSGRTLSSTFIPRNTQNLRDNPERQDSLLLALQARYFDNRLVLGLGYRIDELETLTRGTWRDPQTSLLAVDYAAGATAAYEGRTRTLGAVFHVTRQLSVFYNNSDNFNLPPNVLLTPDGTRASNPEGQGNDYGLALILLDGRLSARASYYKTDLTNGANFNYGSAGTSPQSIANFILNALVDQGAMTGAQAESHRVTNTGATLSQLTEGYEFTLTANPTKNWRLQANFSYTDGYTSEVAREVQAWAARELPFFRQFNQSIVTANGGSSIAEVIANFEEYNEEQLSAVGLVLPGNRKYKVNGFTNYSFSEGPLRGFNIGGGYRHLSKMPIGRYPDLKLQYGPSYWEAHGVIGYRFARAPLPWVKRLRVQLNVNNLTDEDDAYVLRRNQTNPETIRRVRVREPRTWRLTADLGF